MPSLRKIAENIYEIPKDSKVVNIDGKVKKFDMLVPARIYANEKLLEKIKLDRTLDQLQNMACIPGIKKFAIAMSDAHQGYGFCIGGVAATEINEGAISPGGVGYDINCGVRLVRTNLWLKDIKSLISKLNNILFKEVPSGLGSKGQLSISYSDLNRVLDEGIDWAIDKGYGWGEDKSYIEENGTMENADSSYVSQKAKDRGIKQLGTLGSGNHFIEVQRVDQIYDFDIAKKLGIIGKDQVCVMIHTGSRALGHQICTDYLRKMEIAIKRNNIEIPDKELACVLANMKVAEEYIKAMNAAANFAWTNRHIITHYVRKSFEKTFNQSADKLGMKIIYGLAHNILKQEEHIIDGKRMKVNVHRKGATRSFPPGHKDIPKEYKEIGQPVLIPGSMGTASYLCIGTLQAMELSFGSTAHGSGRVMSRNKSKRIHWAENVKKELGKKGISIRAASNKVIAEEAPGAYKDIDEVVEVSHQVGIVKKVVRLVPLAVTKG
ncbi:MAG: RtcB family protein [Promethearchaeota archaeon]